MTLSRRTIGIAALVIVLVGIALWLRRAPAVAPPRRTQGVAPSPREPAAPLRLSEGRASRPTELAQKGELEGRVLSTRTGQGVADAVLVFASGGVAFETRTRSDGAFRFVIDSAGSYQLTALTATGYTSFAPEHEHSPVVFVARPGVRISGVTLFLSPGDDRPPAPFVRILSEPTDLDWMRVTLRGRVLDDATGAGLPGALVTLVIEDRPERLTTDEEGRFTKANVPAMGGLALRASHPDYAASEMWGANPSTEVTFRLQRGGRVSGRVRESPGDKPVVAFTIVALVRHGAIERGQERAVSFFDAEGGYVLTGLRPGTQCLTAIAFGRAPSAEQCLDVPATGAAKADFSLARGAELTGRVFDRTTKAPIARATVSMESAFHDESTALPLPVVAATETDDQGRFVLTGLDSGVRSIFVQAPGHHSRVLPGLQLDADRPPPPVEIDLLATEPGEEPRIESAGINAAVRAAGDQLIIEAVSPGGGAAQAGLQQGDLILRVDGADVAKLGMHAAVERMRGPDGSIVILTIQRGAQTFDVPVTRRRILNR